MLGATATVPPIKLSKIDHASCQNCAVAAKKYPPGPGMTQRARPHNVLDREVRARGEGSYELQTLHRPSAMVTTVLFVGLRATLEFWCC